MLIDRTATSERPDVFLTRSIIVSIGNNYCSNYCISSTHAPKEYEDLGVGSIGIFVRYFSCLIEVIVYQIIISFVLIIISF
jgi:hypothetical protein